jgi:hypothetical protein
MARGWYGLEMGDRVIGKTSISGIEGEVIHLYTGDKNRARIKTDEGEEEDVVCEWCEKIEKDNE